MNDDGKISDRDPGAEPDQPVSLLHMTSMEASRRRGRYAWARRWNVHAEAGCVEPPPVVRATEILRLIDTTDRKRHFTMWATISGCADTDIGPPKHEAVT